MIEETAIDKKVREAISSFLTQSNAIEGIDEVIFPNDQLVDAFIEFMDKPVLEVADIKNIAYTMQSDARIRDGVSSITEVSLPSHKPPSAGPHIVTALDKLLSSALLVKECLEEAKAQKVDEDRFRLIKRTCKSRAYGVHKEYERLHPFSDCNGRTGRWLVWWMLDGNFDGYDFLTWWYLQSFSE